MNGRCNLLVIIVVITALTVLLSISCGQNKSQRTDYSAATQPPISTPVVVDWPVLPADKAQPWEQLDGAGRVVSSINLQSQFIPGVERFNEAGSVIEQGEALIFTSPFPGEKNISWAIYRIPMSAGQPGTIAADVNLYGNSGYYIGVGDYSVSTWHWYGPFTASHTRFNVPPAAYTSSLGNLMLAVVAYDGANFDLVGLGVNARDDGDTTAPPTPSAPTLTAVAGGVLAEWVPVVADDLAGYRLYTNGEEVLNYIEGGTSLFVPAADDVEVTLRAVDVTGNESSLSEPSTATPLAGTIPAVQLTASMPSGMRGDIISLTATGADSYDWDTDGDGTWDITGDTTGTAFAATTDMGIIRPALRAHTASDGFWMGAVSLIIAGNSRPVVSASASPQTGMSPLEVNFTITAEDDDGNIAEYAWDFDGDGIFDGTGVDNPSPLLNTYDAPGLYNAKFRATDNDGSWDVDTVSIHVQADPTNHPPAIIATADVSMGTAPLSVNFTITADDEDGTIAEYAWDFEGDGTYDSTSPTNPSPLPHEYDAPGLYNAKFRVVDNKGSWDVDTVTVQALGLPDNEPPVAILMASPMSGAAPLDVIFDASQSFDTDGSITTYEWDLDNDGLFNEAGDEAAYEGFSYAEITYGYSNYFTATVRLFDDGGAQDTAIAGVTVSGWGVKMLEAGHGSETTPSMKLVNGKPAVAYYYWDGVASALHYTRSLDSKGGAWGPNVLVDADGDVGSEHSLAVIYGHPAIAYTDDANSDLKFVRANDADGATWGTPIVLDSVGDVGRYPSLALINGYPAVSYLDDTNMRLKYIRANDPGGATWGAPQVVDDPAWRVGLSTTLLVVNGNPAISYWDYDNQDVLYVRSSDVNGASWNAPTIVYSTGGVGGLMRMAIINGYPAISFIDYTNTSLCYVHANDIDGNGWAAPVTVDSAGNGYSNSLADIGGYPAISYSPELSTLKYVLATNTDGSTWETPITVDLVDVMGTSLIALGGKPAIAYIDDTNSVLRYAHLY